MNYSDILVLPVSDLTAARVKKVTNTTVNMRRLLGLGRQEPVRVKQLNEVSDCGRRCSIQC